MLHCSTALLFSMHPVLHGMATGLTAITQLSVCCLLLWTVGQCKIISGVMFAFGLHGFLIS